MAVLSCERKKPARLGRPTDLLPKLLVLCFFFGKDDLV